MIQTIVARGIIVADQRILLVQKATGKRAGLWECPGGKDDQNEGVNATLLRELKEEIGMEFRVTDGCVHEYRRINPKDCSKHPGTIFINRFLSCQYISGTLCLSNEHSAFGLFTPAAANELRLTEETVGLLFHHRNRRINLFR